MNAITLIAQDLDLQKISAPTCGWPASIKPFKPSPFNDFCLYLVQGERDQFDFPTLPYGSYGIYAVNKDKAIRLTRKGKEIQLVLAHEWETLGNVDPVALAEIILMFFDGGIKASHHVLRDLADLRRMANAHGLGCGYILNENRLSKFAECFASTCMIVDSGELKLRAVTLMGWMHDKQNLGIEMIYVSKDGTVRLDLRKTMVTRIFKQTPMLRY